MVGQFPPLLTSEVNGCEILTKSARILEAPVGTIGYREGGACGAYVMRLAGQSRLCKTSCPHDDILL